jgi:hypothetical protein
MSALVAFDEGEVSLKSPTSATVVTALLERSADAVDRETRTDALVGNSLWPDRIPRHREDAVLADQLDTGAHDDNPTAIFQIRQLLDESPIERDHRLGLVETAEVLNSSTTVGALLRLVRA